MLTQSPWTQGLLEHSSTSAREGKATCEGPWGTAKPSNGKTSPEELWELWEQPPLTNALPSDVLLVAHVALAAVAGRGGDAAPVQAQVGEVLADVDGLVQRGRSWGAQGGLGSPWMAQELSEETSEGSKIGGETKESSVPRWESGRYPRPEPAPLDLSAGSAPAQRRCHIPALPGARTVPEHSPSAPVCPAGSGIPALGNTPAPRARPNPGITDAGAARAHPGQSRDPALSVRPVRADASGPVESRPDSVGPESRNSWEVPGEAWHDREPLDAEPAVLV